MADDIGELASFLKNALERRSTSAKAWQQGDEAQSMWGVRIPTLAFGWVIGGCDKIPCQRYIGTSGKEKSYKSTLQVEIGNWFILDGGMHLHLDNENKLGRGDFNTMVDAMTWWNGISAKRARIIKVCSSVSEWQTEVTECVEFSRSTVGEKPKGERIPVFVTIDSLTGRQTEEADRNLRSEGAAPERGYSISAMAVTNYLETLNLLGTTTAVGWVQHLKEQTSEGGRGHYGPTVKEKGAVAGQFHGSVHLRLYRGSDIRLASHSSAPAKGSVEGYELHVRAVRTCLGPGERSLMVPILWQYTKDETGKNHQAMWFDWAGALGALLWNMKYNKEFEPKQFKGDIEELDNAVYFSQKGKNSITCKELGLEDATQSEFGRAIENDPEIRKKVSSFLKITEYPSVQEADIDFTAGDLGESKKKKGRR